MSRKRTQKRNVRPSRDRQIALPPSLLSEIAAHPRCESIWRLANTVTESATQKPGSAYICTIWGDDDEHTAFGLAQELVSHLARGRGLSVRMRNIQDMDIEDTMPPHLRDALADAPLEALIVDAAYDILLAALENGGKVDVDMSDWYDFDEDEVDLLNEVLRHLCFLYGFSNPTFKVRPFANKVDLDLNSPGGTA